MLEKSTSREILHCKEHEVKVTLSLRSWRYSLMVVLVAFLQVSDSAMAAGINKLCHFKQFKRLPSIWHTTIMFGNKGCVGLMHSIPKPL